MNRLVEVALQQERSLDRGPDVFIAALGEKSRQVAFEWSCDLNRAGISTDMEFADKSLKSQMKRANRLNAAHVLIVGENELAKGEIILRNMDTKEQLALPIEGLVKSIKDRIRKDNIIDR